MEMAFAAIVLIAAIFVISGLASLAVGRILVLSLFCVTHMKYPPYLRWSDLVERELKDVYRGFPVFLIMSAFIRFLVFPYPLGVYVVAAAVPIGAIFLVWDVARLTCNKRSLGFGHTTPG